jgi:site-specific DNA recombinase
MLNKKVALYSRTASIDQLNGQAQNQLSNLCNYATSRGYQIQKVYADFGFSGNSDKRPALTQLLSDAKRKEFEVVIAQESSRVARDLRLASVIRTKLLRRGVNLEFTNFGKNKSTENLASNMLGSFIQFQHSLIGGKIKRGLRERKLRLAATRKEAVCQK